ncbi:unnamed protein product [Aphanomyces euteiches]|uniref:WRKY transcription factor 19 n=1 Tax=Aphanomyces euteiches TaxID=100861 RepID=A0A6G0WIP7_9STRA|nr:hypothetical protein Ae201684_014833 [Aphanomyces euteiches]KAH9072664.1 hypothetical protein Ae201684P_015737 [Aphanomyces euteiches]KAH9134675.1 hypothetical protein AeRB84_019614 [Aphanomyces euteiches]
MSAETKSTCIFPTCPHPARDGSSKCAIHKRRSRCMVPSCPNQVYARQVCVRHGAKPTCNTPKCKRNARSGGFCSRHAPSMTRKCSEVGCSNVAHQRGKCVRHGGRRQCLVSDCQTHARKGGYCYRHGRLAGASASDDEEDTSVGETQSTVDFITDLSEIFLDDLSLDSTLNGAIKFELDTIDIAPFDWAIFHTILEEI